jgi:broad specificity phosphatase PhoE
MTTTLILVRHGQTAWNEDERFRGRTDLPLDETGLQQVEAAAHRIAAEYRPVAVFSSPLRRAMQTAEVIARSAGLSVQSHPGLIDLDYGEFAGLSPVEAETRFPGLYRTWLSAPHVVRFPGGESLSSVRERTTDLVHQVMERYPGQQVVLVSHQAVCRVLLCSLLGVHNGYISRFRVDTASISVFEVHQSRATLVAVNDTCHLKTWME